MRPSFVDAYELTVCKVHSIDFESERVRERIIELVNDYLRGEEGQRRGEIQWISELSERTAVSVIKLLWIG